MTPIFCSHTTILPVELHQSRCGRWSSLMRLFQYCAISSLHEEGLDSGSGSLGRLLVFHLPQRRPCWPFCGRWQPSFLGVSGPVIHHLLHHEGRSRHDPVQKRLLVAKPHIQLDIAHCVMLLEACI